MTPEQIRIAVAEEMGWKHHANDTLHHWDWWESPKGFEVDSYKYNPNQLPRFDSDLNACHKMEKSLSFDKRERGDYLVFLAKLTDCNPTFATALQRCEAFLRVRGKWKE